MDYSIYKDVPVNDTVERIKNILNNLGIETVEDIQKYPREDDRMPASLALKLFGKVLLSNGKGTCTENARASAYAECIERIQNNHCQINYSSSKFMFAPDEKTAKCYEYEFFKKYFNKEFIEYLIKAETIKHRGIFTLPMFNIKDKKIYNVPQYFLSSSNGMSAGNTPEEALVQGLSEIYERYSMKQVVLENISMPDIPENYWHKYDKIKNLKEYIEECGYKVHIKDASLGENLPVVCTLFKHKDKEVFGIVFGAHPYLPIAIERTLTEFMQGGLPDCKTGNRKFNINEYINDFNTSDIDRYFLYTKMYSHTILLEKASDIKIYNQLFLNSPKYSFSDTAWVKDNCNYTNKELLEFLLKNVSLLQNKDIDIFVRDVSFLNFPAYKIFIPPISFKYYIDDSERWISKTHFETWVHYMNKDIYPENKDIYSLIHALEFKLKYPDPLIKKDSFVSQIPNEYLLLLCHIVTKNKENIDKYAKKLNIDNNKLNELKSNTTFESIKKMISESNIEYFEKQKQEEQKPEINNDISVPQKNELNKIELFRMGAIKNRLIKRYSENTPDQNKLADIFNFI